MVNSSGSFASRRDRTTRSGRAVALDRHDAVHRLLGGGYRVIESTVTILILILISDAVLSLFLHEGPHDLPSMSATPLERVSYWLAYAFTLSQLFIRPRQILRAAIRNPFILAIVATAALSVLWSDDPATSLKRALALATWTVFGYFLASRYDASELLWHLGIALGIIAVASLVSVALVPDYGREPGSEAAWRGVFTTKNVLGEMMLLAVVVFGALTSRGGVTRILAVIGLVIAMVLIAFAKATAALLIIPVLAITIPVVLTFRRNNAAAALVLCLLLGLSAAGSVLITQKERVLTVLGKDATLTGRTVLWSKVVQHIEDRPVLGHGYGAFWEPSAQTSEQVRAAIGWDTPHSHNALLDEWLDLGVVGVLLLLGAYLLAIGRAWVALRTAPGIDGLWAVAFLAMIFLGNATESSILQSILIWTLFVAVSSMRWQTMSRTKGGRTSAGAPARARAHPAARR
jgi:exopolysaccharide production protein ExoQ